MSEQDWQVAVLGELNAGRSGLVTPAAPEGADVRRSPPAWQPQPAPMPSAQPSPPVAEPSAPAYQPPRQEQYEPTGVQQAAEPPRWPVDQRRPVEQSQAAESQGFWGSEPGADAARQPAALDPGWGAIPDFPAPQAVPETQAPPPADQWPQYDAEPAEWGAPPQENLWGSSGHQAQQGWPAGQVTGGQAPAQYPQAAPPQAQQPPAQQSPAPEQVAGDLVQKSPHGDPLIRRVARGAKRAVGTSAAQDVRNSADIEGTLARQIASCRQIAVTSIRGGAGKTTMAALTATVIARHRQDRLLAIDADSGLGSLPLRLGVGTQWSLHDLVAAHARSFEDAARFLTQTPNGLWVLSGTAGGRIGVELELDTFRAALGGLRRFFSGAVIDCGAGLLAELQRGILTDAHAQVMVTPGTGDGAVSARGALEWLAGNGYQNLLARTVIALVTHTPHADADLDRAVEVLSVGGIPVVHVPYDRHLATGTGIDLDRIGGATRSAATRIAVEAFGRAATV